MNNESLNRSAMNYRVIAAALMLALAMFLVSACSSGQASSTTSSGSAVAVSSASTTASSSGDATNPTKPIVDSSGFVGTWNLVDMEKDGFRVSVERPDVVDSLREENYLNMAEDGFFDLIQGDQTIQGVWMADSSTEARLAWTANRDDEIHLVLDDSELVAGPIDGVTLYFEKGDPRETPPLPEGEASLRERLGY